MLDFIKTNWPITLLIGWIAYRFFKTRQVKSLAPELIREGAVLLDVRSADEFKSGSAPDSINIPLGELKGRIQEIDRSKPVIVCCASGTRSAMAAAILKAHGVAKVHNIGSWMNILSAKKSS